MAEEVATINGGDVCLKPTAATRTSQHEDSGGGGGGGGITATLSVPIPTKRGHAHQNQNNNNNSSNNHNNGETTELQLKNKANKAASSKCTPLPSDSEDGFLSTSPDSANGDTSAAAARATPLQPPPICLCTNPANCVNLKNILDSFKAPLSEEQAWALIFQSVKLYRVAASAPASGAKEGGSGRVFTDLEIPDSLVHLSVHRDGSVHCSWSEAELKERREREARRRQDRHGDGDGDDEDEDELEEDLEDRGDDHHALVLASHKKILRKLGVIIYTALDYNLQADEQCQMSQELEELITFMTAEESDDDCIDEGIDEGYKRWDDDNDDDKCNETKDLDFVLEACKNHVKPTVPEDHYKAVCRALVTETIELRIFLQQVLNDDTDNLRLKADSQTTKQELAKLGFNDWARFWVQVIEELRRGVRLKKNNFSRTPIEYELTPYEILMEDIRSKKYQLRKVMVNGDIPPRVKKDAHALILEFIRSRPPLKKASERQLPPPIQRTPSPREQLMDSIRQGRTLKHIQPPPQPRLKDRLPKIKKKKKNKRSGKLCHTM